MPQLDFVGVGGTNVSTNVVEANGWAAGNYYAGPAGVLQGSGTMTMVALVRTKHTRQGGVQTIAGNYQKFVNGGFQTGTDNDRWKQYVSDALPAKTQNFTNADFSTPSAGGPADYSSGTYAVIGQTYDGTDTKLYVQGRLQDTRTVANPGFTATGNTFKLGVVSVSLDEPWLGGICGVAFDESSVATEDEMFDHYLAVRDALEMVDGGLGFEHLWSFAAETGAAAPATLSDAGAGTARTLTLTGALSIASHRAVWYSF